MRLEETRLQQAPGTDLISQDEVKFFDKEFKEFSKNLNPDDEVMSDTKFDEFKIYFELFTRWRRNRWHQAQPTANNGPANGPLWQKASSTHSSPKNWSETSDIELSLQDADTPLPRANAILPEVVPCPADAT